MRDAPLVTPTSVPVLLSDVCDETLTRLRTRLAPLDDVLGGGLVMGSVVVLGGAPGVSKSTLLMHALGGLDLRCLYATGEESVAQVAERARRIGVTSTKLWLLAETRIDLILEHALSVGAEVIAVDSIQTVISDEAGGGAGSPGQVRDCASRVVRFAKATNVACILIGHVTKDGSLGGPMSLAHVVDCVLELEAGNGDERTLRCVTKNRFGPSNAVGRFVITEKGLVPFGIG